MFKKLAAEALGISDIGVIVSPADYDKVDADDYLFHEDGEKIFFLIKSKKDEYCFTNLALIHVDGDSAVSSKRMIKRYGFRAWKVKCGVDKKRDISLLRALRKLVGDDHEITIDCNQGYSSQDLLETAPYFEEVNVALIEEPIPARDGSGKRFCAERTRVPISGDDSCMTPDDVLHELKLGGIRALVIKCARTGYTRSRQILALAQSYYVPAHNGTQADMQIGCVAAAHFAGTYRTPHTHEFSSFIDARGHVANEDPVILNGLLELPPGPGIGLTLDPRKMKKYRVDA